MNPSQLTLLVVNEVIRSPMAYRPHHRRNQAIVLVALVIAIVIGL